MRFALSLLMAIVTVAMGANDYSIEGTVAKNIEQLTSVEDAEEFVNHNQIAIIGFFKNPQSVGAEVLNNTAHVLSTSKFGITSNDDVIAKYEAKDGDVLLVKPFDEKKVVFEGELELENLRQFAQVQSLPLIVEYNIFWDPSTFPESIKAHLLFFVSTLEGQVEKHVEPLRHVAKQYRGAILFVTISTDVDRHLDILEHFDIDEEDVPAIVLVSLFETAKYRPEEQDLSPEAIKAFLQDYSDGKLTRYLLAQKLPDDWNQTAVQVLVSSNFDEVAFDKTKDVLVLFYAPWCSYCQKLEPVYNELGEVYKHNDSIVIVKMNSAANELEHTTIRLYPTIKLYRKDDNKVIDYHCGLELSDFVDFLEAGGELAPDQSAHEKEEMRARMNINARTDEPIYKDIFQPADKDEL